MIELLGGLNPRRFLAGTGLEVTGDHRGTMLPALLACHDHHPCLATCAGHFEKIRPGN